METLKQKMAVLEISLRARDSEATAYEQECGKLRAIIDEFEKSFKVKNIKKQGHNIWLLMHEDRFNYLKSLFTTVF